MIELIIAFITVGSFAMMLILMVLGHVKFERQRMDN